MTTITATTEQQTNITTEDEEQLSFKFDKTFQEKIIQAMFIDKVWGAQFQEVLNVDYFQYVHLKLVASKYVEYFKKYKEFPSVELFAKTIIREELKRLNNDSLTEQMKDLFRKISNNEGLGDLAFVKEKALDFCRKAALQKALEKSVTYIQTENYDKVVTTIKEAISAGVADTEGISLVDEDDIEARYSDTFRDTIATGIPELDQRIILNGGLGRGELAYIVGGTGSGKSHTLIHMGAQALLQGKNVVYYSFELNERAIGIRFDSHLVDMDSLDCYENKEKIKEFYRDNASTLGKLRIKYYPTGSASVVTLKAHLDKLAATGFIPDMIIVDYAGIMRSTDRNDLLRLELKKVCEELRQMAGEMNIPIWTALQANKDGANSDVVDVTNLAESFSMAHVADFILGLSRKSIYIAKNRAGHDHIQYKSILNTSRSKLRVLTEEELSEYESQENTEINERFNFILKKLKG